MAALCSHNLKVLIATYAETLDCGLCLHQAMPVSLVDKFHRRLYNLTPELNCKAHLNIIENALYKYHYHAITISDSTYLHILGAI